MRFHLLTCSLVLAASITTAKAGTIEGVNHTSWAINYFSVDGRSAVDSIGPHQIGGGACCYAAPKRWREGMTVRIDWERGVGSSAGFPGFEDREKYYAWIDQIDAQKKKLSKVVPVPDYGKERVCGITVHFLPCDDVQVTTSCYAYGSPKYPIKIPLHSKEAASCSK
jgi:hypothetical protein